MMRSEMKKRKIPGIGLRIIKSALGVFLCYIINDLRNGQGIVFYSQLAVLWCMQDYVSETIGKAKQRTIGTVLGALYGLLYIMGMTFLGDGLRERLDGICVSIFIVLILYSTVLIRKKQASYFSCVVFLSIVVNHIGDANPYLFVWNRFLDTMIGIGLGVAVNCFSIPTKHHREILFLSGLDDTLLSKENNMSDYSRVELNRMIDDGALFSISTLRTPGSLIEPLKDIHLKLPVIVMDGAALYNFSEKRYEKVYIISQDYSQRIIRLLEERGQYYFANVIIDDLLVIYYQDCEEKVYNQLIAKLRKSPYRNYVNRNIPLDEGVVYFMILDKTEKVDALHQELLASEIGEKLKMLCYPSDDYPGYSYLKIYNHNAKKENMLTYLEQKIEVERVVTFGSLPDTYTYQITSGDLNRVVKLMRKEYYHL